MKKFLIILVVLAMLLTSLVSVSATSVSTVPQGYVGMAAHYRIVNNDLIALDFYVYGDHDTAPIIGNTWAFGFKFDENVLIPAMSNGTAMPWLVVTPGLIGAVDGTGTHSNQSNFGGMGWVGTLMRFPFADGHRITVSMTINQEILNFYNNSGSGYIRQVANPNTGFNRWAFVPSERGTHLFSLYFRIADGYTTADIFQDLFRIYGFGSDAPNGASFIDGGHIVNENFIWVDFPQRVPPGYVGMAGKYRVVNNNTVAIDVYVYGCHDTTPIMGNFWGFGFRFDETRLRAVRRDGLPTIGFPISPATVGAIDGTGMFSDQPNTAPGIGWLRSVTSVRYSGGHRLSFDLHIHNGTMEFYRDSGSGYIRNIPISNNFYRWNFVPSAQGTHLFSLYFRIADGYNLDDISQSSFSLMPTSATYARNGAAFLNQSEIINENFMWLF
ncbi:MAG: hypothetical protein FWE04_05695 [Oscillospiraceae bacterium]|nr:hypothetical protein [Oscillospiraceae bacterium]